MVNWLKVSAWSGILILVIVLISFVMGLFLRNASLDNPIMIVLGFINVVFSVLFNLGFFIIGKKYDKKLLKIFAVYFIIYSAAIFILVNLFIASSEGFVKGILPDIEEFQEKINRLNESYGDIKNIPENVMEREFQPEIEGVVNKLLKIFLILYLGFILLYGIPSILFGVGLLKLGKNVEHSNLAGILEIVGGATVFIGVGFLVLVVAFVLEIVILFNESKKKGGLRQLKHFSKEN